MKNIGGSTALTLVSFGNPTDMPEHSVTVKERVITQHSIAKDFHFQEIQAIQIEVETDANWWIKIQGIILFQIFIFL